MMPKPLSTLKHFHKKTKTKYPNDFFDSEEEYKAGILACALDAKIWEEDHYKVNVWWGRRELPKGYNPTHVVYKIVDPSKDETVYVGSGLPSRPRSSLSNSHVPEIRRNRSKFMLLISDPLSKIDARDLENELIKELKPRFNVRLPRATYRYDFYDYIPETRFRISKPPSSIENRQQAKL